MNGLTEGRIVHFVLESGRHTPAIVVRVWGKETGTVNLIVFLDGSNDTDQNPGPLTQWQTSVTYSEDKTINTWHWIEPA